MYTYTKFNSIKIETNRIEKLNHNHLNTKARTNQKQIRPKTLRHFSKIGCR